MKTKEKIILTLKQHYFFDGHELDDYTRNKKVKELDIDSISMLELFLIIENGFGLEGKLSDYLDAAQIGEYSVDNFFDKLAEAVDKMSES